MQRSASILTDDVIFLLGNMNTTVSPRFKTEFARFSDPSRITDDHRKLIAKMMETDEFEQIR